MVRGACPPVVAVLSLGILLLGACTDDRTPSEPGQPSRSLVPSELNEELAVVRPLSPHMAPGEPAPTIRDQLAAIAQRIPGGFGGTFFDDDGVLNVVLRDPGQHDAAVAALGSEPLFEARRKGPRGTDFDLALARVHPGTYAYDDLYSWYRELLNTLSIVPRMSSIRVSLNRIHIGVANDAQRTGVERTVQIAGIPPEAVIVEIVPQVYLLHLRAAHRPVPGGVQIQWLPEQGGVADCTIGPSVIRLEQEGFLVNSHCTKYLGEVDWSDITLYWQHEFGLSSHIGNEAIDPPAVVCYENPLYGCRDADVALGLYNSNADPEFGKIARPASRNTEQLNLSSSNPRFSITDVRHWSVEGEVLEKVGRTTGWSGGQVVDGCVSIAHTDQNGNPVGPTRRCSMIVAAMGGSGDSGAPVFEIISGTDVELRGILWGGYPSEEQPCVNVQGTTECPYFLASNLGGIESDLDPDGNAPLEYYPAGGGGGGGGPPGGPECPPNCVEFAPTTAVQAPNDQSGS